MKTQALARSIFPGFSGYFFLAMASVAAFFTLPSAGFAATPRLARYPLVIMYHEVVKEYDPRRESSSDVSVEDFKKQLKILRDHGYVSISGKQLENAINRYQGASLEKLPKRSVLLTFDDGYAGNYENAVPILRGGTPRKVLVSDAAAIDDSTRISDDGQLVQDTGPEQATPGSTPMNAVFFINPFTIENGNVWNKHMTWAQIRELDKDPLFEIGSHTYHHLKLDLIHGPELEFEFTEANRVLKEKIKHTPKMIAYPFGRHSREAVRTAMKYHDLAFVVGTAKEQYLSTFQIPRMSITTKMRLSDFERAIENFAQNPLTYRLR